MDFDLRMQLHASNINILSLVYKTAIFHLFKITLYTVTVNLNNVIIKNAFQQLIKNSNQFETIAINK